MNHILLFTGKHRVDILGASRIIAQNVVRGVSASTRCFLMTCGVLSDAEDRSQIVHHDLSRTWRQASLAYRALGKATRVVARGTRMEKAVSRWSEPRLSDMTDRIASSEARRLFRENPDISSALGLSSMSARLGRLAKRMGRHYAIHCQWSHPYVQNKWVGDEYRRLGLGRAPFSRRRTEVQLEEFELADLIWCPSRMVRDSLVANGVAEEKTVVHHLGIDLGRFQRSENGARRHGPLVVLFVGRVCVEKGIPVLLEALEQSNISNAHLILNGEADGPTRELVDRSAERLAKRRIRITFDPGDPRRHFADASLLVLPSVHDAYGITVIEGMAGGLPVIVSSNVGAKESVEPGKNGFVFQSGNSGELAEYLEFFDDRKDARIEFGRVSYELSRSYDATLMGAEVVSSLEKL